jgi:RNA recognition motif-containing protein
MGTRLYVGNVSYGATEGDIQQLFEQSGAVKECHLVIDRFTSRSRGFAFVEMETEEDAQKAIEECNGYELDGRPLVVNEARPRVER